MRLIDADWITQKLEGWQDQLAKTYGDNDEYVLCLSEVLIKLDDTPTAQPELIRPKAKDVYYEETDHCEFKCSLCHATIGVVEGGTLDGAWFRFCPNCGAEMEGWCERPD